MSLVDHLSQLSKEASEVSGTFSLNTWSAKVASFLKTAMGPDVADEFLQLSDGDEWFEHSLRLGHLQGLIAKTEAAASAAPSCDSSRSPTTPTSNSRKVFIVHGHDEESKAKVARFLDRLGLTPIILHEQPSSGRTIIEKFEIYSGDIAFAVILLTPDDVGASASQADKVRPRARQNVVLELGYFIGRLGRSRVCALHKGDVELPSDYQGVIYVDLDALGAWQAKLAQEFVQAKLAIDLNGLLGG